MAMNLEGLRKFAEDQMTDECVITRDPEGHSDDTFDEKTGTYIENLDGGPEVLYSGKCFVKMEALQPLEKSEGGAVVVEFRYILQIPLDGSPSLKPNDSVTVIACLRDPELVSATFIVDGVHVSSFSVARIIYISRTTARRIT